MPVWAWPSRSRPSINSGIAAAWIGGLLVAALLQGFEQGVGQTEASKAAGGFVRHDKLVCLGHRKGVNAAGWPESPYSGRQTHVLNCLALLQEFQLPKTITPRCRYPAIVIGKALDVVLTKQAAALHFDDQQPCSPAVARCMQLQGTSNCCRLGRCAGAVKVHDTGQQRRTNAPGVLMALQRERWPGSTTAFNEIALAFGQGFVPAPGTSAALHRLLLAGLRARG